MKTPEVSIMKISPAQAERWLEQNDERNRFIRQRRVSRYIQDMREGNWVLANQVIVFDVRGRLINGQHTLTAVCESNKTIECIVLLNAPEKAKMVMDTTAARSSTEHFRMMGRDYPSQAPSTARRIICGRSFAQTVPVSDFELDKFIDKHQEVIAWAHHHFCSGSDIGIHNATFRAIACRASIAHHPRSRIEQFAYCLKTGLMDAGDNAAILLRNFMLTTEGYNSGGVAQGKFYYLVEAALDNFLKKNTDIKKLRPVTRELFPINSEEEEEGQLEESTN